MDKEKSARMIYKLLQIQKGNLLQCKVGKQDPMMTIVDTLLVSMEMFEALYKMSHDTNKKVARIQRKIDAM